MDFFRSVIEEGRWCEKNVFVAQNKKTIFTLFSYYRPCYIYKLKKKIYKLIMKVQLTKQFDFEMAHALMNYDGHCKNIHGHSYKLYITIEGEPNSDETSSKCGMVMDFGDLKKIVYENIIDKYDHALVLNEKAVFENSLNTKLIRTSFQPTCENMLVYFYQILNDKLPHGVRLCKLRMYETATSYAELVL